MSTDPWLTSYITAYRPACPICGRPLLLHGLACSRCHMVIRLGLRAASRLYRLAWGIAVASSALCAGCGLFLLLLILRRPQNLHRGDILYQAILVANCVLGVFQVAATLALLVFRRWFCRWPWAVRWGVAALFAGILVASVISLAAVLK